jgi:threonine dehydratase
MRKPAETAERVREAVRPTTILKADRLGRRLGVKLTIASETFQHTGSFKFRAAWNVAAHVPHPYVIAASSGNFGQALASACQLFGKRCRVIMPDTSAQVKVQAVRDYGGEVDLIDVTRIGRKARVAELARKHPEAYIASAYDDPLVIQGNASLGDELAAVGGAFDLVLAPVGGGGLTAGLITGLRRCGSKIPVVAVEPLLANDAARSIRTGQLVANETEPATIADGVRTLSIGQHNWQVLRDGLADVIEVSEEKIKEAVRLLFNLANLKAEPTGALGIAAILARPDDFRDRAVCCVVSGGNVDPELFRQLLA